MSNFSPEFIEKFNSELRAYVNHFMKENGEMYMPFIDYFNRGDVYRYSEQYENDPQYAKSVDEKSLEEGCEIDQHTHFEGIEIDGKIYNGKLYLVRQFLGEYKESEHGCGERGTKVMLPEEDGRDFFASVWVDGEHDQDGAYVNVPLNEETKGLMNHYYESYRIFSDEIPEETYSEDVIKKAREHTGEEIGEAVGELDIVPVLEELVSDKGKGSGPDSH